MEFPIPKVYTDVAYAPTMNVWHFSRSSANTSTVRLVCQKPLSKDYHVSTLNVKKTFVTSAFIMIIEINSTEDSFTLSMI